MKKTLIISGAVALVLALAALWVYVMFFGTPRTVDEIMPNFNLWGGEGAPAEPLVPASTSTPAIVVNVAEKALRQLTTRPVAGYREVRTSASSSPELYYAEVGTGHIYSINLTTGTESRISGTTIPEAVRADFSEDGKYAVIASGFSRGQTATVAEIDPTSGSLSVMPFTDTISDFVITKTNELLYTQPTTVLVGKVYSLPTRTTRTLFTLPFREATVSWGEKATDTHYAYPRPTRELEGYGYSITGTTITRLPLDGYGFSLFGNSSLIGASYLEGDSFVSVLYDTKTRTLNPSPIRLLPEKCTYGSQSKTTLWCGTDLQPTTYGFPDTWYTGEIGFQDSLYEFSLTASSSALSLLTNTFSETGREVDIVSLRINPSETQLYFINKNDSSLWAYDLSR